MAKFGSENLKKLDDSLLLSTLDNFKDVVCIVNKEGVIVYVNEAVLPAWGYQAEEMIGRSTLHFQNEDDLARPQKILEHPAEQHDFPFFANRIKRKDGSVSEVEWHNSWDEEKELHLGIAKDVTVKRERTELRNKNARLQLEKQYESITEVLERITEGFYALDKDYIVTYWNDKSEEITGVPRELIVGKPLWEVFSTGVGGHVYLQHQTAMKEHVVQEYETYYAPLSKWYLVNTYPSPHGLSVFFKDITRQKKAEEEIKKLSLIVKKATNAIVITDAANRITWVNDAFTKMTGYSMQEAAGQIPGVLLQGPKTDEKTALYIQKQLRRGKGFQAEILGYTKTGSTFWSDIHCQPVYDDNGKIKEFFSIETDITERKAVQKQVTLATIEAQEKERYQVGQELHDNVNQVLTTVKLYLELCRDGITNTQELLDRSVKLLLESINEIRALSKRLSDPTIGEVKLKDSIADLVDSIGFTNKLNITLNTSLGNFKVHKELHLAIYRIVQEHLTNILKHAKAKAVEIGITKEQSELSVIIVDDGIGFNVHEKRKGIGITNMRSRAESLNGTFNISSTPGIGCTLFVNFQVQ